MQAGEQLRVPELISPVVLEPIKQNFLRVSNAAGKALAALAILMDFAS